MERVVVTLLVAGLAFAAPVIGIMSAIVGFMSVNPFLQVPDEVGQVVGLLSLISIALIVSAFVLFFSLAFRRW